MRSASRWLRSCQGRDSIDRVRLDQRIAFVNRVMSAHGGRIEVVDVSDDGNVQVRFAGLCGGCAMKPLTMESIVRPSLCALADVTTVVAIGVRVSDEVRQRIALPSR
jgi:Fe-S cluster biogenesis protein NfuA